MSTGQHRAWLGPVNGTGVRGRTEAALDGIRDLLPGDRLNDVRSTVSGPSAHAGPAPAPDPDEG
ncbi:MULTISPECIES: hypothetical protein [unclassified Streptomyces]|uniref:hypothetical protein n=1 Tax=unclassified Streptomyces TaxID=2593676 RepID=UPI0037FA8BEA